jgi:hypothetical protein
MPWFYFDLLINEQSHHQGGMILENINGARDRANELAEELHTAKPELEGKRCFVRVIDESNEEIYRTSLDPVPKWSAYTLHR